MRSFKGFDLESAIQTHQCNRWHGDRPKCASYKTHKRTLVVRSDERLWCARGQRAQRNLSRISALKCRPCWRAVGRRPLGWFAQVVPWLHYANLFTALKRVMPASENEGGGGVLSRCLFITAQPLVRGTHNKCTHTHSHDRGRAIKVSPFIAQTNAHERTNTLDKFASD